MLFKPDDRHKTVTAFRAEFDPFYTSRFIRFQHKKILTKKQILDNSDTSLEYLTRPEITKEESALLGFVPSLAIEKFRMVWIYNMIPTETEWDKFCDNDQFVVTFRNCTLLTGSQRVAILQPIGLPALRWSVHRPESLTPGFPAY